MQGAFSNALTNIGNLDALKAQREAQPFQQQLLEQRVDVGQAGILEARETQRQQSLIDLSSQIKPLLDQGDTTGALQLLESRIEGLRRSGVPTADSEELAQIIVNNPIQAMDSVNAAVQLGQQTGRLGSQQQGLTAGQRERQSLLATLEDPNASEVAKQSARIDLGTEARAVGAAAKTVDVGGVPHVFDPVKQTLVPAVISGEQVTAETVGESKATIKQREKFGELTGSSRAKAIDKGFDRINGINKNILNINRAIAALDRGAGTGPAEKFFPSIRAASRELDQIQGELALDVIGAVTFGALSQGELDLARDIALPTGLDEPELKDFLQRKRTAQEKLRNYFNEQIQFLDQGGTVAGFLRSQQTGDSTQQPVQPIDQITPDQLKRMTPEQLQNLLNQGQ